MIYSIGEFSKRRKTDDFLMNYMEFLFVRKEVFKGVGARWVSNYNRGKLSVSS